MTEATQLFRMFHDASEGAAVMDRNGVVCRFHDGAWWRTDRRAAPISPARLAAMLCPDLADDINHLSNGDK